MAKVVTKFKSSQSQRTADGTTPIFGPSCRRILISERPKLTQRALIVGLTLLAFALRLYRLDFQSYWIDEALTVRYANLSPAELQYALQTVRATPPLYHALTLPWANWLGDSEFSLRYLSLWFSVAAVPLTYRLGRTLGGYTVGALAALLMTVAPYQVWHAQDARNYSMLTAAAAMSMWGFVNLWRVGGWRWALIYFLGTEIAIMIHYHGLVIIGVQGLFFLLTPRRHGRFYLRWAGLLALALAPFAGWMAFGSRLWQGAHWLPMVDLGQTYLRSAIAYSLGEMIPPTEVGPLLLPFAALFVAGAIYALRRTWGPWPGSTLLTFLLTFTLAPNLAAWIYSQLQTPVYLERYLISVQVGYLITIALGLMGVAGALHRLPGLRRLSPGMLAGLLSLGLVGVSGSVLDKHYHDPVYAKPDWRRVVRTIEAFSLPGDAIIMTGDGGELLFDFYYRGDLPVFHSFNTPAPTPDEARQQIARIAAEHGRLWYTPYGVEIDATLEGWLAGNSYPAWNRWLGRKRLGLYETGSPAAVLSRVERRATPFPDAQGMGPTLLEIALPDQAIAAGDLLPLRLTWQTETPLTHDYRLSLRLVNARGDHFAQSDWPPLTAERSPWIWPVGEPVEDRRSLWIPVDVPPGAYALQLVVYDPETGQGFGQPALIEGLRIAPAPITPPLNLLSIPNRTRIVLGPLALVGYAAPAELQPGRALWLWLYWQAQMAPPADLTLRLSLSSGGEQVTTDFALMTEPEGWQPGQVRRAVYHLPTSPRLNGENARIGLTLIDGRGQVLAEGAPGAVRLNSRERVFEVPVAVESPAVAFGSPTLLTLLGRDLPANPLAATEELKVTLYWQAQAEIDVEYTVFVQLLDASGQVVAQIDQPPQGGAAPTTTWLPGEVLTDPYQLTLPTLSPGDYRLIGGLYNPLTGARLLLTAGGDHVALGRVVIE